MTEGTLAMRAIDIMLYCVKILNVLSILYLKEGALYNSRYYKEVLSRLKEPRGAYAAMKYWRERDQEVDFVFAKGKSVLAIEVKSGGRKERLSVAEAFAKLFKPTRIFLVGGDGIPLEEFLSSPIERWREE